MVIPRYQFFIAHQAIGKELIETVSHHLLGECGELDCWPFLSVSLLEPSLWEAVSI